MDKGEGERADAQWLTDIIALLGVCFAVTETCAINFDVGGAHPLGLATFI